MAQIIISPGTSDLGTITSDIQYTVTSDTTGTLTVSIVVNGAPFAQQALASGVPSTISVMQLPTGAGNISLTATLVESGGGATTQNVTWTYNKTPINFSNSGSVASLGINGENILPTTLAEAVRTSPVWGGSLDLALQKLSSAAFYETVTPTAQLGSLTPGDIIYLNENGSPVEFYVASLDYEPDYNDGRVLVVRKEAVEQGTWNSSGVNTYDGSTIDTWMNGTYLQTLDSNVQSAIGTTNIPYTPMGGTTTVERISKAVFQLSATELGKSASHANIEGTQLSIASSILAGRNATWTRTPYDTSTSLVYVVASAGNLSYDDANVSTNYYQPSFTLPSTFTATLGPSTSGLYDLQNNLLLSLPGVKIETGSYTGTGTDVASITFYSIPKYVVVYSKFNNAFTTLYVTGSTTYRPLNNINTQAGTTELVGLTLTFSSSSAQNALNENGKEYKYLAIL